ncbi:MAG: twin-arginine translocase subunit TatC [Pyramidobacter sp.]
MEELKKSDVMRHFTALRRLILFVAAAVCVSTVAVYAFAYDIVKDISFAPLSALQIKPVVIGVAEGFFVKLKLSLCAGIFIVCPFIILAFLVFIFPALYKKEKLAVAVIAVCGTAFFVLGCILSYCFVLPLALRFFLLDESAGLTVVLSYNLYFSFLINFLWPFGVLMEMPLIVFLLTSMGLLTPIWLKRRRKVVIVFSFIVAAFLTPPDMVSQIMLAIPMLVFYELSILVSMVAFRLRNGKVKRTV